MTPSTKIKTLIREVISLGPVFPGTITKIYNVCGKKECKCKDPESPKKHGPYNLLSYTIGKKSSSKFIKDKELSSALSMQQNYQRLKSICQELPLAYLELFRNEGMEKVRNFSSELEIEFASGEFSSEKSFIHTIRELEKRVESWRSKAIKKTSDINAFKARIKQLEMSRDNWKERALINEKNDSSKKKRKTLQK